MTERDLTYFTEPGAWGAEPHDLAALAAYHLGLREKAIEHGEHAHRIEPADQRLEENLRWYRKET